MTETLFNLIHLFNKDFLSAVLSQALRLGVLGGAVSHPGARECCPRVV